MSQSGRLRSALVMAVFYLPLQFPTASCPNSFTKEWAATSIWVLSRLPMQPKTRKSPTGDLPRIASTGCVYTQPSKMLHSSCGEMRIFEHRGEPLTPAETEQKRPAPKGKTEPDFPIKPPKTRKKGILKWTNTETKTVPEKTKLSSI